LRPLAVGEILDNAIQVYRKNFRAFVTMTAVVVVPLQIVSVLITLSARPTQQTTTFTNFDGSTVTSRLTSTHDAAVQLGAALLVLCIGMAASRLAVGACTRGVADAYLGGVPANARDSLMIALRRWPSLLLLELLTVPAIAVGLLFCLVPGVWLWVSWLVATPVLLVEGAKPTRALGRSFELVKPRWWAACGLGVVAVIFQFTVSLSLRLLLVSLLLRSQGSSSTAYIVAAGVISAIAALFTLPVVAAAFVILYFDLRVRAEGLDLQMVLARLDSAATAAPPPFAAPNGPQAPTPWGARPPAPPMPPPPPPGTPPLPPPLPPSASSAPPPVWPPEPKP
jgi:hypothetical protein